MTATSSVPDEGNVTIAISVRPSDRASIQAQLDELRAELRACKERLNGYDEAWAEVGRIAGDPAIRFSDP